jgi:hypothetical protein
MEAMDAFGVRVRIGAELVVAGCEALSRHWNLIIVDIQAEIRATHPRIRPRSVCTLRQQRFSCRLIYQTEVPFYTSVGGVSERSERTGSFIVCSPFKCAVRYKCIMGLLSVSLQSFYHEQLLLSWKSGIEISVLFLSLHHSADTRQIWRLSAPPKSCSRYQSIIIVLTIMLIIIYVTRTNKMHTFFIND